MKSTFKIVWTDEAIAGLKEIIEYIEKRFPEKDVRKFIKKLDDQINFIQTNPKAFPLSAKSPSTRRAVVARLTSVFYSVEEDRITLLSIFDNRKDPKELRNI
jgi:plasmid stabilization system protein ParE